MLLTASRQVAVACAPRGAKTRQRLSAVALIAGACALAGSASAFAATGRIVVKLRPPAGADTTGFVQVCAVDPAREKKYGVNKRSIVGKCGNVGAGDLVVLKRVPVGRWGIAGVGGVGAVDYPKRVRVRDGRTTRVSWTVPMWG